MIARARMAAGMSIDDLAYKSKLRATIISAIERDDFSLCGGEVYARGQVRALAAIVGLDPGAVMQAYEARGSAGGPPA
ncbi:MAG: helix-turn-helix domain-containing protein [Actinomycetales bacterium]